MEPNYGKINKEWHMKNKMLENASEEQRIRWHLEHSKNCSCRPIPLKVLELIEKKGIKTS
jgi:hypothetical protein